jgi:hypothetical protein
MPIPLAKQSGARLPLHSARPIVLTLGLLPAGVLVVRTLRPLDPDFGSQHFWARGWFSDDDPRLAALLQLGCRHPRRGLTTRKLPLAVGSWRYEIGVSYWCRVAE